jgi:hypothetical protein
LITGEIPDRSAVITSNKSNPQTDSGLLAELTKLVFAASLVRAGRAFGAN